MTRLVVVDVPECPACPRFDNWHVYVVAEANGSRLYECKRCGLLLKVKGEAKKE